MVAKPIDNQKPFQLVFICGAVDPGPDAKPLTPLNFNFLISLTSYNKKTSIVFPPLFRVIRFDLYELRRLEISLPVATGKKEHVE